MITGWIVAFPIGALTAIAMGDRAPKWLGLTVAACLSVAVNIITNFVGLP